MSLNTIAGAATALCLAAACAGCALPPEKTADGGPDAKQYRTGSNIPVKEGQAGEVKTVDPNSIQLERPRSIGSPLSKGG